MVMAAGRKQFTAVQHLTKDNYVVTGFWSFVGVLKVKEFFSEEEGNDMA